MKKLFVCAAVMYCLATAPVSSWDASRLTSYPDVMWDGDWLINVGAGIGYFEDHITVPILLTFEYALPIGGLPFTLGGLVGIFWFDKSYSTGDPYTGYREENPVTYTSIPLGFRLAYHFNFGVDNLDTYLANNPRSYPWV